MTVGSKIGAKLFCAALIALGTAAPAAAASYSISGGFNNSVFAYGKGTGGGNFTPFTAHSACAPQLDCYPAPAGGAINKNVGATDYNAGTVHIAAGTVDFHPFGVVGNMDTIIRFIAPTSATWYVSGRFWRNDTTSLGDGTTVSIFANVGGGTPPLLSSTFIAPNSYGQSTNFAPFALNLYSFAGDAIEFALSNNGNNFYDSTGIEAFFTDRAGAVPEPATWAMLIAGFGLTGIMVRRRADRTCLA